MSKTVEEIKEKYKFTAGIDFYLHTKEVGGEIEKISDQLSPQECCELMEFFGPQMEQYGKYSTDEEKGGEEEEYDSILSSYIFVALEKRMIRHMAEKTTTFYECLRMLDAICPYDGGNQNGLDGVFYDIGRHVRKLLEVDDGKEYLFCQILKREIEHGISQEIIVSQYVFEEFLSRFPSYEFIRFFSVCPSIVYKVLDLKQGINFWYSAEMSHLYRWAYQTHIIGALNKIQDRQKRIAAKEKLRQDPQINPLVKGYLINSLALEAEKNKNCYWTLREQKLPHFYIITLRAHQQYRTQLACRIDIIRRFVSWHLPCWLFKNLIQ